MPEVNEQIKDYIKDKSELFEGKNAENIEILRTDTIQRAEELANVTDELKDDFTSFLETADLSGDILEQYQAHLEKTGKSVTSLSTFTAKAGSALKSFGAALASIGVNWAISELIFLAVKGFDELINSAEHCKERVDSLIDSYKTTIDAANSNAETVESIADRYEELSKGVNNLGENISLTTEEYSEYNKIVNQIADMFPALIQGYTNEGNAILSLKGNVEALLTVKNIYA